jgi:hypothetical protein
MKNMKNYSNRLLVTQTLHFLPILRAATIKDGEALLSV